MQRSPHFKFCKSLWLFCHALVGTWMPQVMFCRRHLLCLSPCTLYPMIPTMLYVPMVGSALVICAGLDLCTITVAVLFMCSQVLQVLFCLPLGSSKGWMRFS